MIAETITKCRITNHDLSRDTRETLTKYARSRKRAAKIRAVEIYAPERNNDSVFFHYSAIRGIQAGGGGGGGEDSIGLG